MVEVGCHSVLSHNSIFVITLRHIITANYVKVVRIKIQMEFSCKTLL